MLHMFCFFSGDTTGWQMCYLREVLVRQEEERENLLRFLQDESMDDLRDAAAMMTEAETKSRLAELHSKRRRLDLSNEGMEIIIQCFFSFVNILHKTLNPWFIIASHLILWIDIA